MSRANKKKPGMPNVANDLSQKLYATMEKHKEVGLDFLPEYHYFHSKFTNVPSADQISSYFVKSRSSSLSTSMLVRWSTPFLRSWTLTRR